jgi:hypothetical protein
MHHEHEAWLAGALPPAFTRDEEVYCERSSEEAQG